MREILESIAREFARMAAEGEDLVPLTDESVLALKNLARLSAIDSAGSPSGERRKAEAANHQVSPPPQTRKKTTPPDDPPVEEINFVKRIDIPSDDGFKEQASKVRIVKKPSQDFSIAPIPDPKPFQLPEGDKATRWEFLKNLVLSDPVCSEHLKPGKKVVFGTGNLNAQIFFCGEAPGADEEIQGEPFVGKAGQLLTKIIAAMGLERRDVYIGNIMNWRPELPTSKGNRPPTEIEMAYCLPYLLAQIDIVKPKVIVALGNTAVTGLLGPDPTRRMGKVRGTWRKFHDADLMITYHPSFLLQYASNSMKRLVWEDMMAVMERVGMEISPKQRSYFQHG